MIKYKCNKCNKGFTRKHNYEYHINNIQIPCWSENQVIYPQNTIFNQSAPTCTEIAPKLHRNCTDLHRNCTEIAPTCMELSKNTYDTQNDIFNFMLDMNDKLKNINLSNSLDTNICLYCESIFTRQSSLQRHQETRCKLKKNFDELEKLKERLNNIVFDVEYLKNRDVKIKNTSINNNTDNSISHNTNQTNQTNNGVINNNSNNTNNITVQLVQFGCENIDEIDSNEALNVYYKSTGGNILSNILKLTNFNDNYPQNHNICISDLSREFVKVFNGKKFIIKKFKDVKGDIMYKVIKNTQKLVDKIESDDSIVLSEYTMSKMKINNVSLRLINGDLPEDIVRAEVREKDKLLENKNTTDLKVSVDEEKSIDSEKEREFNLEERLRIKHLQSKQQGLIDISIERLKDELYNGKDLIETSKNIVKKYIKIL
jgi:hypothetical protein